MTNGKTRLKEEVKAHWEAETCGTRYGESSDLKERFSEIRKARYALEPWIPVFQNPSEYRGKEVLEIGVGAGSDFIQWVSNGALAAGIDLTEAAIEKTRSHLAVMGFDPSSFDLRVADAEALPFRDSSFHLVYAYGVLHHSPDTTLTLREAYRVLKPGGDLKIMIYHHPSWTALMMWLLHFASRGRFFTSLRAAVYEKLESPGTKSYTVKEARSLIGNSGFEEIDISLKLSPGDLLLIKPSDKYQSFFHRLIWKMYPRRIIRMFGDRFGLLMLITARKR